MYEFFCVLSDCIQYFLIDNILLQSAADAKARGNAAYKKKDFETAIKEYKAAIELDGSDMTYYNNMGGLLLCFWFLFVKNNNYYLNWK